MLQISRSSRGNTQHGFTFIEIMVVVMIIGLLMAIVIPNVAKRMRMAQIRTTQATLQGVGTALHSFSVTAGRFPSGEEGLEALFTRPTSLAESEWEGPYLEDTPIDAWKQDLIYRAPGVKHSDYDLISMGPDKKVDTEDDVTNEPRRRRVASAGGE